jgi:glycosyltransferase involved in cell wall biosynthesis
MSLDTLIPIKTDLPTLTQYPIGVIIPTFNRPDALRVCLQHLEQQSWKDFEVVVVDDGSTDSTPQFLEEYQQTTPLNFRFLRQDNRGPACARNLAIAVLGAPICLMIGDDIFASPSFVFRHLELHRQRPEMHAASLGLTRWSDSGQRVTPFMRWLEECGVQFGYKELLQGARPTWRHFYTSNLSLKTQVLRENPFNELFTKAAAEDIELGYRLDRQSCLEIIFIKDAVADHLHPTSFRQACKRNIAVGSSVRLFHEIWPEASPPSRNWRSQFNRVLKQAILKTPFILWSLTMLAELATMVWCPNPIMRGVLECYFALGYRGIGGTNKKPPVSSVQRGHVAML